LAGLGLVVAIMVGLYGAWGLLASAILGLNVALTLAALGLIGATLTLPGIAGIILCLGIAVDANILIFSRIREETAKGASAMKALAQGYDRAWGTILDANVTTLLAMGLLFLLGAGAIRGFAITMSIGILVSMFTAITLMRIVMEGWARHRRLKRLEIPPLLGRVPVPGNWSFLRHGRLALAGSAVLSAAALAALAWPGPHWGIDFTGGVQMTLSSASPIPLAELRAAAAGFGDAALQTFGAPTDVLLRVQGEATQATVAALEAATRAVVPDVVFDQIDLVGPTISGELGLDRRGGAVSRGARDAGLHLAAVRMALRRLGHPGPGARRHQDAGRDRAHGLGGEPDHHRGAAHPHRLFGQRQGGGLRPGAREPHARAEGGLCGRGGSQSQPGPGALPLHLRHDAGSAVADGDLGRPAVAGFALPMIAGVVIATASSLLVAGPLLVWMAQRSPVAHAEARS
jgi:SecD/SecF fusion protein